MNTEKKTVKGQKLTGERALYGSQNLRVENTLFLDGESPLKESQNIELYQSTFKWKYPLWYCHQISVDHCTWLETARAGVWYSEDVTLSHCAIEAPKNFRRCKGLKMEHVSLPKASETLWSCTDVTLDDVVAHGDYFGMNSEQMEIDNLTLYGNYAFDGCRHITMRGSQLLTKDAFWNCEDVTVYDSYISGEYLGWNSKNLTFVNCTIESLQGLCYIENLKMVHCTLINTNLAFEYSSVDAEIDSSIDSVLNPKSGIIRAQSIGELIIEKNRVTPGQTKIICQSIEKTSDHPDWIKE